MGWIHVLVCDGCGTAIEPQEGTTESDRYDDELIERTAKNLKWELPNGVIEDGQRRYYCPTCARARRETSLSTG